MKTVLALYRGMTIREKVLLALVVWSLVAAWGTAALQRLRSVVDGLRTTSVTLETQAQTLELGEAIQRQLDAAMAEIDTERTLDGLGLNRLIQRMATDRDLRFSSGNPDTELGDIFNEHQLEFRLEGLRWEQLKEFERALQREAPYVSIEAIEIDPERNRPHILQVDIIVSSFQLTLPPARLGIAPPSG